MKAGIAVYHGFLIIDKPAGMTSHDVVARVRRVSGQRQVGHAGTLDPAATGVLVVALGGATRLIEYVQDETSKHYRAVVELGATTTTDDAEGEVIRRAAVPALDRASVEQLLAPLRGVVAQVPPIYSALHHQGKRLYELARAGEQIELAARLVRIDRLDLITLDLPRLTLEIESSKGTYIRALARDLGAAAGCGAFLRALRRTAVGGFSIERAVPLDQLAASPDSDEHNKSAAGVTIAEALLAPDAALSTWPSITLSDEQAARVRNGLAIEASELPGERARAHNADGSLLAVLMRQDDRWRPHKVFDWQPSDLSRR